MVTPAYGMTDDPVTQRVDAILGRAFYHAHPDRCPDWDQPVEREDDRYEDEVE